MKRTSPAVGAFCFFCLAVGGVHGAEMGFVPVSASGAHTIIGTEIILEGGGQTVFLEIQMSDWSPTEVRAYEATLDSSGLSSGISGVLTPTLIACTTDADCTEAFGGFCDLTDEPCFQTSDCEFPEFEVCVGPEPACAFPPKPDPPEFCAPGFVHEFRSDYVFRNVDSFEPIVDLGTEDFRWASLTTGDSVPDPGFPLYGGTLVLDVPVGAIGTFVIELLPTPASVLIDPDGFPIAPLDFVEARITIKCQTDGDCDDDNACTDDTCNARNGTCVNVPNFDEASFCCNPADGTLTPISDDNECTEDICDPADGTVSHPPLPGGTACGDPTDAECDNPDTCDGAGVCQPNFELSGTSCGDSADTECDNPDTCDGAGVCQPNVEPAGTFCGDPADTDCTDADTCDGAGTCQPNHAPDGTECSSGFFCIVGEACSGGVCVGGADRDCSDGLVCTTDECNEDKNQCDNDVLPGHCVIDGVCRDDGEFNPDNDCEVCNPDLDLFAWSPLPDGSLCEEDASECTLDVCVEGICAHPPLPAGTACGDPTDTECDNPDTCDGDGVCRPNFEPADTPCSDPSDTDCTDPDACDGAGTCQPNHAPDGESCSTGFFCIVGETCMDGECVGGADRDCSDGLACTTDECNEEENRCDNDLLPGHCLIDGVCRDDGEFNPDNECEECNPAEDPFAWSFRPDGSLCTDDGNECTFDFCESGVCIHPTVEAGTPCGDPADTECDNPDTCDGDGVCQPNLEPAGTLCGDSSDTGCTDPDTCDGAGTCLTNHAPDGTECSSGFFCIVGETCADGECVGGADRDCSDGLACTTDDCNEDENQCDNDLLPGHCLIDGVCRDDGEFNPDNDCEECNPAVDPFAWSFRPDGSSCTDDGNECTFDFCEIGACAHPPDPADTACDDPTDTECDNPDTCDGQGVCLNNFEPADTPCGDPTDTQCTDPDACDGSGACQPNHAPDGEPCDDEDVGTDDDACLDGVCVGTPIQQAPVVTAFGPRRISVRPTPPGAPVSVALLLTSPDWPCLELYLNPDGSFTTTPVFQLIDDWGTVFVDGVEIAPNSRYDVVSESKTLVSEVGSAQTSLWGDVVGTFDGSQWTPPDERVVIQDIVATIDRFLGKPTAPPVEQVDVWPCNPDGLIVIQDIVAIVDAFLGKPYPCPLPCP